MSDAIDSQRAWNRLIDAAGKIVAAAEDFEDADGLGSIGSALKPASRERAAALLSAARRHLEMILAGLERKPSAPSSRPRLIQRHPAPPERNALRPLGARMPRMASAQDAMIE